jgi:hypothetical protein
MQSMPVRSRSNICCLASVLGSLVLLCVALVTLRLPHSLAESATITVSDTVLGYTTKYIGATEGGSFDIDDLTDCGISTYRIWIGMSDVEYCDDDDPRGYIWECDQGGNTNYGSPAIATIKANPNVIDWNAWDVHINDPDYRWRTSKNPDTAFGTMVGALSANGIIPVLTLRNRDEDDWPAWAPDPPTTTADLNEWWQYCFAVAYWFNVRNSYGVTHFEVHNEPDLSSQGWSGTKAQYAQLLVPYAYDAVKTANDLAGIDTFIMASVESQMPFPRTYDYFDDVFYDADSCIEIADFHWYHMNGTYPLSDLEAAIDDVRGQITAHNPDGVIEPLWVSEYGNFSSNAYDNLREAIRTAQQLMIFSDKEVQGVHIFTFYDWGGSPGLVKASGTPTETYYSYRLMIRGLIGGKERLDHTASGFSGTTRTMVTRDAEYVYIIVLRDDVGETGTVSVDLTALGSGSGTVTVWEYSTANKDVVVQTPTMTNGQFTFTAPADGISLARTEGGPTMVQLSGLEVRSAGGWPWVVLVMLVLGVVGAVITLGLCLRGAK